MNLYDLHKEPTSLNHHNLSHNYVPKLAWLPFRPKSWYEEREEMWAKDAQCAYLYATKILKDPFPKGEDIIAKHAGYSFNYAHYLGVPFPKGERAIAKSVTYSFEYSLTVLHKRFLAGEEAIKKNAAQWKIYCKTWGIKL